MRARGQFQNKNPSVPPTSNTASRHNVWSPASHATQAIASSISTETIAASPFCPSMVFMACAVPPTAKTERSTAAGYHCKTSFTQGIEILSIATSNNKIASKAERKLAVSYTHLRAHETDSYLVCRLLLE